MEKVSAFLKIQKNAILKQICGNCGLPSSGKKDLLVNTICDGILHLDDRDPLALKQSKELGLPKDVRLLSIDLGIKNFSYCKFVLPKGDYNTVPEVYDWSKLNVFDYYNNKSAQKPGEITATLIDDYTPNRFSEIAYHIATELVMAEENPIDVILIEQQRSRTTGSSAVQEWTLRVNMLEHMLYSTLFTLKQSHTGLNGLQLVTSSPKRMSDYFINCKNESHEENPTKRQKSSVIKRQRIKLVENWIDKIQFRRSEFPHNTPFIFQQTFGKKLKNNDPTPKVQKRQSKYIFDLIMADKHMKGRQKSDDLVDSLLHGVSWFSWMKNRMILRDILMNDPNKLMDTLIIIENNHSKFTDYQEVD
ncbi:cruciform cutting endonuclease [Saccharomycopsis crataegensis]|uniref:Cruciform cutting endonuclease n=1 Tax=Saccharomycopsis crataegensis TaxID=43959 RepID=A0AAV5QEK5_9ASCO|nr:cruciform cutting endonuclease [Saccharomycopsis crataegensis]